MRLTALAAAAALTIVAAPALARADGFHMKDDPSFSVGLSSGLFHLDDSQFDVTWTQIATLDLGWSPLVRDRKWFPRFRLHGLVVLDRAELNYREDSFYVSDENLAGIYRADVQAPYNPTLGGGGDLTIFENSRFQLRLFADYSTMARPTAVDVSELVVEVNGLRIDVARAVDEYATLSFDWSTFHAGLATGLILRPWGRRVVPYATIGLFSYKATFAFEDLDPRLEDALIGFGIDPQIIHERSVSKTKLYATTGVRVDLTRNWSLETDLLIGRVDDAWLYSVHGGAIYRWDF